MRNTCILLLLVLFVSLPLLAAEQEPDPLKTVQETVKAVRSDPAGKESYQTHVARSEQISAGLATLTGEAVNPLLGVTVRSLYVYWWETPAERRASLPWYYQPKIWLPLLLIMGLMVFKSTLCEAVPLLKKPLDALADVVSKAGAAFSMPLVLAMFADTFTLPAAQTMATAWNWLSPVAYAGETVTGGGAEEAFFQLLGWIVSLTLGTVIYVLVWLAFNTIEVLILISPFPVVDAALKSFRIGVIAALWGLKSYSPTAGVVMSIILTLICALIAGWSLRLSVFGFIYSTDILLFRSSRLKAITDGVKAFSNRGLREHMPMRTYGRLQHNAEGQLVFSYRPWLVLPRRSFTLPESSDAYHAGEGLINPYIVRFNDEESFEIQLRLPPRYTGHEAEVVSHLGLAGVRDTSMLRGFRALWRFLTEGDAPRSTGAA